MDFSTTEPEIRCFGGGGRLNDGSIELSYVPLPGLWGKKPWIAQRGSALHAAMVERLGCLPPPHSGFSFMPIEDDGKKLFFCHFPSEEDWSRILPLPDGGYKVDFRCGCVPRVIPLN